VPPSDSGANAADEGTLSVNTADSAAWLIRSVIGEKRIRMAEYGEWNQKGATLSDVTAEGEYGVSRDFIVKGIQTGKLEYRDGTMWGNPYFRILRGQLEKYISEELGDAYLVKVKKQAELRKIKKEIFDLKKKLKVLESHRADIEESLKK